MFDINLKTAYNPTEVEEDALIEYTLQKPLLKCVNRDKKVNKLVSEDKRAVYLKSAKKLRTTIKNNFDFFSLWGCVNRKAAYICNRFQKRANLKVH